MALTISLAPYVSTNNGRLRSGTITFDNSYNTGGESLLASDLGLDVISSIVFTPAVNATPAAVVVDYDYTNKKVRAFRVGTLTPTGTVAAPIFTGTALAAHRHVLHFQTSAAANAVTAAANALRTAAAAFDVAGVANSSGEGGVVDASAGTPAGTNDAPVFTGVATGQASLAEVTASVNLSAYVCGFIAVGY